MSTPDSDDSMAAGGTVGNGDSLSPLLSSGYSESLGLMVLLSILRGEVCAGDTEKGAGDLFRTPISIGRFRLEGLLGSGAYGAVFRAHDTHLDRRVALKVAWPSVLMDPVTSRRFTDEPKTVAALQHPGIVEVFDSGNVDLAWFIALELVEGPNLAEWVKGQSHVPLRLAAEIVRDIACTIHFAHEHDVVHRDLKPSNILLRRRTVAGTFPFEPVVTDFGLAHRPRPIGGSLLTATQAVLGTDHYMSPEQVRGVSIEIGRASDIFSLGVILYEMVAGRRPFDADNSDEVRRQIREDEPAAIRHQRRNVPKDLETIIFKCLEKTPDHRYRTSRDLADDLTRFLNNEPIQARPVTLWKRVGKYTKRKPLVVSIAGLALCSALVITGTLTAWIADRISAGEELAAAKAATELSERTERQHQYASNIQRAAEALRHGRRRDVLDLLEHCRALVPAPDRCGIEWDLLWGQVNAAERTFTAHPNGVAAVRFSPAGGLMASGGRDGRVVLWDTETWERRTEIAYATEAEVSIVEFSTDGSLLAIAGEDGRLAVYRVDDAAAIYDERVAEGRIFALAWMGDRKHIAVGGDGTSLSVIDPLTHEHRRKEFVISPEGQAFRGGHPEEISALAYIPDRKALAVFLTPSTSYFVDAETLEIVGFSLQGLPEAGAVCRARLDSDYLLCTTHASGGIVGLWKTIDPAPVNLLELHGQVRAMRFSPVAEAIAIAFGDGSIQTCSFRDVLAGRPAIGKLVLAHSDRAVSIDWSPDGARLATGGRDGDVKLWRASQVCGALDLPLAGEAQLLAFSPCGRWLAVSVELSLHACEVTVFDARELVPLWSTTFPCHRSAPFGNLSFGPTGDELALAESSRFCIYDAKSGTLKCEYSNPSPDKAIVGLYYSTDGTSILARQTYAAALIIDRRKATIERIGDSTDNHYLGMLATTHGDTWIVLRDTGELTLRAVDSSSDEITLAPPPERIGPIAVSRDGRYLAGGSVAGTVFFWDLKRPDLLGKLVGHEGAIRTIDFSDDGHSILSSGNDGTVRVWHLASSAEVLRFGTRQRPVHSMALNPAGTTLVLGRKEGEQYGLEIHRLDESRNHSRGPSGHGTEGQ